MRNVCTDLQTTKGHLISAINQQASNEKCKLEDEYASQGPSINNVYSRGTQK